MFHRRGRPEPGDPGLHLDSLGLLLAIALVPSGFLLLVVRPGATSSVLAPSSDALCS